MPAEHDYPDPALNERERLEKKRGDSAFAFELGHAPRSRASVSACATCDHPPEPLSKLSAIQSRIDRFGQGIDEHYDVGFNTDEQYKLQLQQRQNSNYLRYQRGLHT